MFGPGFFGVHEGLRWFYRFWVWGVIRAVRLGLKDFNVLLGGSQVVVSRSGYK